MNLLVTGGTGFVGGALLARLAEEPDVNLAATVRRTDTRFAPNIRPVPVPAFDRTLDCEKQLRAIDAIVHLVARVHVMRESAADALGAFRRVNVDGTLALAKQAANAGVRRFVFVSSIKVNGESTAPGRPFAPDQSVAPVDPYGRSKWEAEEGLRDIARVTGMEIVVIRPPLVYGPGVGANFLAMMKWLHKGSLLPLGAVTQNRRSLVAVSNLVDLIAKCSRHTAAAGQTFLVSDAEDLSTADLLKRLGRALGTPPRLIAVPVPLLRMGATLVGRSDIADRLLGSLVVDISKTSELLGWHPPVGVDRELEATARHYLEGAHK